MLLWYQIVTTWIHKDDEDDHNKKDNNNYDNDDDQDDGDDGDDIDDIYIMMKCLSVCNEKWSLS